jgi:hypothetical protein
MGFVMVLLLPSPWRKFALYASFDFFPMVFQ